MGWLGRATKERCADDRRDRDRVQDVSDAYEYSGYDPDEIMQLCTDRSLSDIHRVLAYYYDHIDNFRRTFHGVGVRMTRSTAKDSSERASNYSYGRDRFD